MSTAGKTQRYEITTYEITTYESLIEIAKALGNEEAADLLRETLAEEQEDLRAPPGTRRDVRLRLDSGLRRNRNRQR